MTRRDIIEPAALVCSGAIVGAIFGDLLAWLVWGTGGSGHLWALRVLLVSFGALAGAALWATRIIARSQLRPSTWYRSQPNVR